MVHCGLQYPLQIPFLGTAGPLCLAPSLTSASPLPAQALSLHVLVCPQVCCALNYLLPSRMFPLFAYRAVCCISFKALLKHYILPGVSHDSPVWTFGIIHCIIIASLYLLGGSMRMGTITLFSSSWVSNTGRRAWYQGAWQLDADWVLSLLGQEGIFHLVFLLIWDVVDIK